MIFWKLNTCLILRDSRFCPYLFHCWALMLRRYSRVIKSAGAFVLSTGGLWICYNIYAPVKKVNGLAIANVLTYEKKEAEYLYLNELLNQVLGTDKSDYTVTKREETFLVTSAIVRWWTAIQKRWAWRVLYVAKYGERSERQQAVISLSKLTFLSDSDYRTLAQACNASTAVGLARTEGSDLRFFLPPPKMFQKSLSGKELKEKTVELLQGLENLSHHSCVENFLSSCEHNHEDSPGVSFSPLLEEEVISKAIDILAHHCSIGTNAKDLLHLGALPILMELLNYLQTTSSKQLPEIFSILSYLSVLPDVLPAFFMSGWIGVLAKWSRNANADIALPCVKTLSNLDCDSPDGIVYPEKIFPLFPQFRKFSKYRGDIVFVHGLLGTVYVTWRQRDSAKLNLQFADKVANTNSETPETSHLKTQQYMNQLLDLRKEDFEMVGSDFDHVLADLPVAALRCRDESLFLQGLDAKMHQLRKSLGGYSKCWARDWLPQDCPNVRILGINYTSSLSQWFPLCSNKVSSSKMAAKSVEYLQMLQQVGVGDRPIVWVTHSMGGLLVKHMLTTAYESADKDLQRIFRNTKAIVFFSCPHMGSEVADLKVPTEMLFWPSVEVQELRYRSPALVNLHLRFLQLLKVAPMEILSFAETKATNVTAVKLPITFVRPHSADPGTGEFYEIPLDHISICKPAGRYSFLYRKIVDIINKALET